MADDRVLKAVVDTGPLFNFLTFTYVSRAPLHRVTVLHKHSVPDYLRNNPTNERNFLQFFNSIRTVLTTSHVIGEIQGLQKLTEQMRKDFWLSSMFLLKRMSIDEKLLRLNDMHASEELKELVCLIGPTDTGLIALARQEGCVLLTDDERTLERYARALGIDCRLIRNSL